MGHKQLVFSYGLFCNNADVRNRRQKKTVSLKDKNFSIIIIIIIIIIITIIIS